MMLQEPMPTGHPLADTVAQYVWLLPVLPLLGFVLNGALSLKAAAKLGPNDPSAEAPAPSIRTRTSPTTTTRWSVTSTRDW